jgi:uncharacterized protein YndB with AHSA1/START domain
MTDRSVVHGSFTIERVYRASPAQVFAAFAKEETKRRWFAEGKGWEVDEFTIDFRVGGRERSRFRFMRGPDAPAGTPPSGTPMGNDTVYMDIVPERRIVFAYTMSISDKPFSASLTTIELHPKDGGTELVLTEQGAFFEGSDGPELREKGWRSLLAQLEHELATKADR